MKKSKRAVHHRRKLADPIPIGFLIERKLLREVKSIRANQFQDLTLADLFRTAIRNLAAETKQGMAL